MLKALHGSGEGGDGAAGVGVEVGQELPEGGGWWERCEDTVKAMPTTTTTTTTGESRIA